MTLARGDTRAIIYLRDALRLARQTTTEDEMIITVRAKAFSGRGVETVRAMVEPDGTVRVYDDVAGYYTLVHSLSRRAQARIRRLAR
jgi:hypothetical protein